MRRAASLLRQYTRVLALSSCWETEAVSSSGAPDTRYPNFYNLAVCIATGLEPQVLKTELVKPIEVALGRVRSADKYAPRTIDIDVVIYDDQVLEPELWKRSYLALTLAELLPDLANPQTGETLRQAAARLGQNQLAVQRPGIGQAE
jgi:2-amino-4-hydroxy-6-hydroxymethyldihydropteridine diphosphokinase